MKKTLIAIAAIAAMGAASAEVTLYGKLDAGVSVTTDSTAGAVNQGAQFGSSNYETSRLGVKGSSEIAGGVKGIFQLEGKLGATDGTLGAKAKDGSATSTFNREAFLGLTGGFGTVAVGKMWTPYDSAFNDAMEYNGFSAMGNAFYGGAHGDNGTDGTGAAKNAFQYTTPTVSGFNVVVMYAPNADATATNSATNYTGFGVNYANGPLTVNLATEKVLTSVHNSYTAAAGSTPASGSGVGLAAGASPTPGYYTNAWILAASYNIGVATVNVGFESATGDYVAGLSGKDTGSSVGVSIPVNKATTVALGYATETTSANGLSVSDGKTTSAGAQVVYAWNAATAIYAGYNKTDTTAVGSTTTNTGTKFATGVRYNF